MTTLCLQLESALHYPVDCPVKAICQALARPDQDGREIVLRRGAEIVGIIYRFQELVDTHSFPGSPFPVGQLLKNVVLAARLASGAVRDEGPWAPLRSHDGRLIALLTASELPTLCLPGDTDRILAA